MIVAPAESHVISSKGLTEKHSFNIETNAHAFKILSSGLYSDKISAVLREIGCNAHDAHISVGKSHVPFEVKLPNAIDQQFYIKDFGPGLSHDDIMGLYTTYFKSTKRDSNETTGAFGLGSKSPFSYTDSFIITSCHNGYSRIYSAHIGDNGSPNIALMSTVPTDETGITISFPVSSSDFRTFADRAQKIYSYFTPFPKILGGDQIKPNAYTLDMGGWALIDHFVNYHRQPSFVQMGNVCYPLSLIDIGDDLDGMEKINGTLLRFNLGELAVAVSREKLQYDPVTKVKIKEKLIEVGKHFVDKLNTEWEKSKNGTWIERCNFQTLKDNISEGFNFTEKFLEKAGVKDFKGLFNACSARYIQLPVIPATHLVVRRNKIVKSIPGDSINYDPLMCIVAGNAPYSYIRTRTAIKGGYGGLTGSVIHVKGTEQETALVIADLKAYFGDMPVRADTEFDRPLTTKRLKGLPLFEVDLDGAWVQIDKVPQERKIYQVIQRRANWGTRYNMWYLGNKQQPDNYHTNFLKLVKEVSSIIKLETPIPIKRRQEKRCQKHGCIEYSEYLKKTLLDKKNIALLRAAYGKWRPPIKDQFLITLRQLKESDPDTYKTIKSVLGKVDDILSLPNTKELGVHSSYIELAKMLEITVPNIASKKQSIRSYPKAEWVTTARLNQIAINAPKTFPKLIKELLT